MSSAWDTLLLLLHSRLHSGIVHKFVVDVVATGVTYTDVVQLMSSRLPLIARARLLSLLLLEPPEFAEARLSLSLLRLKLRVIG